MTLALPQILHVQTLMQTITEQQEAVLMTLLSRHAFRNQRARQTLAVHGPLIGTPFLPHLVSLPIQDLMEEEQSQQARALEARQ